MSIDPYEVLTENFIKDMRKVRKPIQEYVDALRAARDEIAMELDASSAFLEAEEE